MRRAAVLLTIPVLAACGGGGDEQEAERTPAQTPAATSSPTPAPASGVERAREVITGWSNTLGRSDVDGAAAFFALPLVVSQGRTARLTTRAQVRIFNSGLPCGSKVTGVEREDGYFVASFVLTERPGQRCDGPGNTARVAFKLSGDKIHEWRQLVEEAPETEAA